jgi:hypothetical protein
MKTWQVLGGVGVGRPATVVIVAFVAVLVAVGCRPERSPPAGGRRGGRHR